MEYKTLGVSAGNGVMLHPFKDSLIGNIEIRREYLMDKLPKQWSLNFPGIPFITEGTKKVFESIKESHPVVDFIIGHPKCGNSSMFALSRGKKFTTKPDEPTLSLFFKAVKSFQPKMFAFENLPKLLETLSIDDIEEALDFKYEIFYFSGSVSFFGNSQLSRNRLVVIGIKGSLNLPFTPTFPDKSSEVKTCSELLRDCPGNGDFTESIDEEVTLYGGFKTTLRFMLEFWRNNPDLRHYPVNNGKMGTAPGVYINRADDYPLTVRKTNRQFNQWGYQMSPREMARIQGIPDEFKILDIDSNYNYKTLINKGRFTVANTPPYEIGLFLKDLADRIHRC